MSGGFTEVDVPGGVALARDGYTIIDVREQSEWDEGHVPGATLIPLAEVVTRLPELVPDRATPILLHCRSGARSGRAAAQLVMLGYSNVVNVNGFIAGWRDAGGAWEEPVGLTASEARRYARQIALPEIGAEGQRRLSEARILVVGAGGLGSPAAMYLAGAGVGTIGLVDDDVVEESNLHRQLVHPARHVGARKVESAAVTLRGLNPALRTELHAERLTAESAERLIAPYDVVVDATDSFEARYAINDAAVGLGRTVIHGAVYRWQGQVTTLVPGIGPCYRCLHPVPPPAELAPDCDVAGVAGVLPGVVGTLQATEVLKIVLGVGEALVGRLLTYDALSATFETVQVSRDPACPACGSGAAAQA